MTENVPTAATVSTDEMAPAPYKPINRRSFSHSLKQFWLLLRIVVTEYRETWGFHAFFSLLLPLGFIFFLITGGGGEIDTERAVFLLGGSLAASAVFGPAFMTTGRIGYQRENKEFDYWVALPVGKLNLILAIVSTAFIFALPGFAGVYFLGSWMLGLPLSGGLVLMLLVPFSTLPLSGLGAFLGVHARDGLTANLFGNLLIIVFSFLSPMLIPIEALPRVLQGLAYFVPTTYVAEAFRAALVNDYGMNFWLNVFALFVFTVLFLWVVHRKLDWRVP